MCWNSILMEIIVLYIVNGSRNKFLSNNRSKNKRVFVSTGLGVIWSSMDNKIFLDL